MFGLVNKYIFQGKISMFYRDPYCNLSPLWVGTGHHGLGFEPSTPLIRDGSCYTTSSPPGMKAVLINFQGLVFGGPNIQLVSADFRKSAKSRTQVVAFFPLKNPPNVLMRPPSPFS